MPEAGSGTRIPLEEAVKQAYAHWSARNPRQAEEISLRVLAAAPAHPGAHNLMSLICYSRGDLGKAIAHLEKAALGRNVPATVFSNLAEMLRQSGRLPEAEFNARQATKIDPKLPGALSNLGIILQESGRLPESRDALTRAIALDPRNAETHNNLANTLKRMGFLKEAQEHWLQAMRLKPGYAEPHSNISLLFIDEGRADKAVIAARRAIELNPRLADAYVNLASAYTALSRHSEALATIDNLTAFAPNHAGGLSARALALKNLDRFDEAIATARRATELAPQNGEAHAMLGQVLQTSGDLAGAMQAYDRAAQLPGNSRDRALINRAVLLMEHGQSAEAEAAFAAATSEFPRSASAWFNRSDLVKFKPDDPSIQSMNAALTEGQPRSQTDRMLLHFALGKAWLDIGDSEKAFEHLNEGNRLKRSTLAYDPAQTTKAMQNLASSFGADVLARLANLGDPSDRPIFVVGMPRSGTTLIEQILASHPDVYGAGELRNLQHVVDSVPNYPAAAASLGAKQLAALGAAYVDRLPAASASKRHVVDKMPANFLHAGMIRLILPNARIIHSRREAADTCLSCYSKLFQSEQSFSYDLAELGSFHRDYETLMQHWRTVLPASHFIEVDYEAVVDDAEGETRRMLEFLGLEWNDACLEFYRNTRSVRTASVNQVRQPIYKSSAGRWRKHEKHLQPLLRALGR
ncbi:MAG TPA: sulfotransferase [Devosia sp.]|nr:sulfotransferase [Devosia sp.]